MLSKEDIREKVTPIAEKYNVARVDIFGSYANGNATYKSDIDFLVEFAIPVPSIFKVMGFREELRRSLGVEVDVVTLPLANPQYITIGKCERIL
jgi:predicted nucleotidyltransferase